MKTLYKLTALAALALIAMPAMGQSSTLAGTSHDFTAGGGGAFLGAADYCVTCHAPHDNSYIPDAPLWNHAQTAVTSYLSYDSATMNAAPGVPTGSSLLCLSCHDGSAAIDSYGGAVGTTFIPSTHQVGDGELIDNDLRTEHPVGITYETADTGLRGLLEEHTTTGFTPTDLLRGEVTPLVQCTSCHNPHSPIVNFLVAPNTNSALCLTCHVK